MLSVLIAYLCPIAFIVLVVYICKQWKKKKRKEEEKLSIKISKNIMQSEAFNEAMAFFADLSHLTRECVCNLTYDGRELSGKLFGEVVNAPVTVADFKSFHDIIFRAHEHFQEETNTQVREGKIDIMQSVKLIEDDVVESHKKVTAELLGGNTPNSRPFINYLRGDIKPLDDKNMIIKHGFVMDFLHEEDTINPEMKRKKINIFLNILQDSCSVKFSNCRTYFINKTSFRLVFTPV